MPLKKECSTSLIEFPYKSTKAREYGIKGFGRRLFTMRRCIANVFRLLPPSQAAIPKELTDVEINLQSFLANTFGALDNMAWVWVYEGSERTGSTLPDRKEIGLRKKNKKIRLTLSPDLARQLDEFDDWFQYIEDYRDALAHRIPLYVIPYIVNPEVGVEYDRLNRLIENASIQDDYEKFSTLSYERSLLEELSL